jgi:RNA polymerase sigma factor (sigma-70 family)
MTEPGQLVEHFFRHEYGRIVAVLVRSLGIRHLELAEDCVQDAMRRALQSWGQGRIPDEPAGWLLRAARRLAIDSLRRTGMHERWLGTQDPEAVPGGSSRQAIETIGHEIGDEPLRLLFLCCHPGIPAEAGVALALKTVAGFGTREIAAALLSEEATIQKRIERARSRLRELSLELEPLHHPWMKQRLSAVRAAIYLLFNEGYLSSQAEMPIRHDLCEEALRLARLLGKHPVGDDPETHALAGLICLHSARSTARVDPAGALVLLDDQDRRAWDAGLIREGMEWMRRSAVGENLSRYHVEAAIAWEHSRAADLGETDWGRIISLYELLARMTGGPVIELNRAVAESRLLGPRVALQRLDDVPRDSLPKRWALWHAVRGQLCWEAGQPKLAMEHLEKALAESRSPTEQKLIRDRLEAIRRQPEC